MTKYSSCTTAFLKRVLDAFESGKLKPTGNDAETIRAILAKRESKKK